MKRSVRVLWALSRKEASHNAPFFLSYLGIGAALFAIGMYYGFHPLVFVAIPFVPFFLGVQVFGTEMADGTCRFAASLPVRPEFVWLVKAGFAFLGTLALLAILVIAFALSSWPDEAQSLDSRTALFFAYWTFILSFLCISCATLCAQLLRRPLPAVLLAIPLTAWIAIADVNLGVALFGWGRLEEWWALLTLALHGLLLVTLALEVFVLGRGHVGFPRHRIAAALVVACVIGSMTALTVVL